MLHTPQLWRAARAPVRSHPVVVGWCLGQFSKRSQAYCVPDPLCAGLGTAQALAVALDELCLLGSVPWQVGVGS